MKNNTYVWLFAQYTLKAHHVRQVGGFCYGISEIKKYVHVNSVSNHFPMVITSLTVRCDKLQGRSLKRTESSCLCVAMTVGEGNGTHSSTLAWKIPWMERPGRLQVHGVGRSRNDWVTSLSLFTFMHWRRKWQPTPVFLPGESQGWGSLVGCHLWGSTGSDTTEAT